MMKFLIVFLLIAKLEILHQAVARVVHRRAGDDNPLCLFHFRKF
jgi:hypothetical protein